MRVLFEWLYSQKLYILLLTGSLFGWFWLLENKKKLNINSLWALILSIANSVFGLLFVKIFAFMEGVPGGMSLFGGVFFLPILYFAAAKLTKRNVSDVCDVFAICTIFTVMCARTNCLLSGCCGGTVIPGTDDLHWPTQFMEIVFYIILIVVLGKKIKDKQLCGKIYPLYWISYGVFRFLIEFIREKDPQTLFHLSHLWAVLSVLIGLAFYYYQPVKQTKQQPKHRIKIEKTEKGDI